MILWWFLIKTCLIVPPLVLKVTFNKSFSKTKSDAFPAAAFEKFENKIDNATKESKK